MQTPAVLKLGYSFKPCLNFFHNKNFSDILELLMPAFLSSTIGQIGIYVDIFFASSLAEGQWTAYGYANRIFQFPIGLMLSALLVPLFPLFSFFYFLYSLFFSFFFFYHTYFTFPFLIKKQRREVSINRPASYEPAALPLRHPAIHTTFLFFFTLLYSLYFFIV